MNGDSSTTVTIAVPAWAGRTASWTVARRALTLRWRNRSRRRRPGPAPRTDLVAELMESRPARTGG
jgi:hypothetical protein